MYEYIKESIISAADGCNGTQCAVRLVSDQQRSNCNILVWDKIQGSLRFNFYRNYCFRTFGIFFSNAQTFTNV